MNNTDNKLVRYLWAIPVVALVFFGGFLLGKANVGGGDDYVASAGISSDKFSPFWTAWRVLDEKGIYAASTTDDSKLWGSIQGLASSYNDPYTVFFPPAQSKIFQENISGDFGGVGMEIGMRGSQIVVVSPLKDSPAESAGVKSGEAIVSINGSSTLGMNVDKAVSLIRGRPGTVVKISFMPNGAIKPIERSITRDIIKIPTIETLEKPGGVFVIRLFTFTSQSPDLFREALKKFVLSGSNKLVLDLRGNPGGYLDAAWDMASYFLPSGKLVVTEDFKRKGVKQEFRSKGYNVFNDSLRMVIIVNEGSASASEILAGALREHGVAKLVGEKTFGKGSVQELVPITAETSLKVTVANWLTPNGHNLSQDGLEPDFPVKNTEEDGAKNFDRQMERAIEIVRDLK